MPTATPKAKPDELRGQLLEALRGGSAHADPKTVMGSIPESHRGTQPEGLPHSAWQLVEHMRFTLADLYEFSTSPEYVAPDWPDDYWPKTSEPPSGEAWEKATDGVLAELERLERLVEDPEKDLTARLPWGQGQNILREVLLAVAHTSYHMGQLVLLRRLLGDWKH